MSRDFSPRAPLSASRSDDRDDDASIDFGPLADGLGYVLRRAQLASAKSFQRAFAGSDISPAQFSALLIIEINPGLRQNQVSDALGVKHANFVGLIDKLEKRGLVQRMPAADRRSHALYMTLQGRKIMKSMHAMNARHEARIRAGLSCEQQSQLLESLKAVAASVDGDVADTDMESSGISE